MAQQRDRRERGDAGAERERRRRRAAEDGERHRREAEGRPEPGPEDHPHEHRTAVESGAHRARNAPGRESAARRRRPAQGVLIQVCERCGKEYFFDDEEPPPDLTCGKCGNGVFRSFFDVTGYDDVEDDFRRSTERDLAPNDDESDVTRADVLDLNNP